MLRGEKKNYSWQNAQKMMNNPQKFIDEIRAFDGRDIDEGILARIASIRAEPHGQNRKIPRRQQSLLMKKPKRDPRDRRAVNRLRRASNLSDWLISTGLFTLIAQWALGYNDDFKKAFDLSDIAGSF